ncbi:hypothetical protein [uncultured Clostridium sp.]|uniref:hypothetical protein n=1 Tax=uncultured Clostridium sp. TaxID=59620 RepID=UPI0025E664D1|nr:hypothetical protein [uncultured Clostridium sp.]
MIDSKYARLKNGQLEYATKNWRTDDGKLIVNFTKSPAFMLRYGFKEVIDEIPEYNYETHYITFKEYIEEATIIKVTYDIVEYSEFDGEYPEDI